VACSSPVEGLVVPVGVEADEVEGGRGVDVLEAGLGQAAVAGTAGSADGDGLPHGSFAAGAPGVIGLEVFAVLRGPAFGLGLVD
jgi:hypothetical protein